MHGAKINRSLTKLNSQVLMAAVNVCLTGNILTSFRKMTNARICIKLRIHYKMKNAL